MIEAGIGIEATEVTEAIEIVETEACLGEMLVATMMIGHLDGREIFSRAEGIEAVVVEVEVEVVAAMIEATATSSLCRWELVGTRALARRPKRRSLHPI